MNGKIMTSILFYILSSTAFAAPLLSHLTCTGTGEGTVTKVVLTSLEETGSRDSYTLDLSISYTCHLCFAPAPLSVQYKDVTSTDGILFYFNGGQSVLNTGEPANLQFDGESVDLRCVRGDEIGR